MTYLVLDLETVPDGWTAPPDRPDAFPPIWAQRVVCAAWCRITTGRDAIGGWGTAIAQDGEVCERDLLHRLSLHLSSDKPTLVTYNGRRFDLPVLVMRCLRHGVQLPWHYQMRGARYRYSEDGHLDLADCLTDYGACSMMALDDVARSIGLPGKVGVSGADVADLFRTGRLDEIAAYCLSDVAQTALLFLRFRLVQGAIGHAEYESRRAAMMQAFRGDPRLSGLFADDRGAA